MTDDTRELREAIATLAEIVGAVCKEERDRADARGADDLSAWWDDDCQRASQIATRLRTPPSAPAGEECDCHRHERQVCDVCQGVDPANPPKDATPAPDAVPVDDDVTAVRRELAGCEMKTKLDEESGAPINYCGGCFEEWPCALVQANAALDRLAQRLADAKRERKEAWEFAGRNMRMAQQAATEASVAEHKLAAAQREAARLREERDRAVQMKEHYGAQYTRIASECDRLRAALAQFRALAERAREYLATESVVPNEAAWKVVRDLAALATAQEGTTNG